MRFHSLCIAGAVLLASCTPSRSVLVQLVSNMAPGREIDTALVVLASDGVTIDSTRAAIPASASLGRPVRLASYVAVAAGRYEITVTLRRGDTSVQSRRVVRDVDGATVVTVLMTRECNGVACPGTGDPSAEACLGGRCVQPECDEEHPELCPMPECTVDGDCAGTVSTVACAPARCSASGTCFTQPDDARCASGQLCDSQLGCVAVGADAGPIGGGDAGIDAAHDAGHDANADASPCSVGGHFTRGGCVPRLDVNGDDVADLVVGASSEDSSTGAAYFYRGSPAGPVSIGRFATGTTNEHVGLDVAGVGDANGDGFDDVLVSGHVESHAYLFLGATSMPATLTPSVTLGAAGGVEFGQFLTGVGDVNADGLADAVVSEDGRAMAHLFLGRGGTGFATLPSSSTMAPDLFGTFGPGDLDGDGAGDLALPGAFTTNEHVHVYLARSGAFASATPAVTLSSDHGTALSYGALGSGDVNGDGLVDLLVGAHEDGPGAVYVYLGRPGAAPAAGPTAAVDGVTGLGWSLTGLGDVDGDGFEDVAVSSNLTGAAQVSILHGSATGALVSGATYTLPVTTGRTALPLDAADLNGDGAIDLVVGDPSLASVRIVAGPLLGGSLGAGWTLTGPPGTNFGVAIAAH